jgi:hypothetical protein
VGARHASPITFLLIASCGYIGDPLPPALNIPAPVSDFRAQQRGGRIFFEFTIPERTTEDLPLKLAAIELRAGAKIIPLPAVEPGAAKVDIPALEFAGQQVVFAVRLQHVRGRSSDWSNAVNLSVVAPLETPAGLDARAVASGVRIVWRGEYRPGIEYRIYRQAPKQAQRDLVGRSGKPEWIDSGAEYGSEYRYWVQSALPGSEPPPESEVAGPFTITPVDSFPPATPSGATAIAGVGAIDIAWEPNTESDLQGYRVYRAVGTAAFEKLVDMVESSSYSDTKIESNKPYRYALTAVDQAGNESPKSQPVEVIAP